MITLDRVTYSYPQAKRPALDDVTLQIDTGEFVAIVGENGAGKSTLCAALAGLVPHHFRGDLQGKILVDGIEPAKTTLGDLAGRVGLVFQNPYNQLSGAKLTVAEEVAFGLENLGVPRPEMLPRIRSALARVGAAELADRSPFELSGGEVQRVALACILVMEPAVLVLDEPTAQLDPMGAASVLNAIRALASERRHTVVVVEQKTEWIAELVDRVIVLHEGRIALDGAPRAVLASPRLGELGVRPLKYTVAARAGRNAGLWPRHAELPVTLGAAAEGFRRLRNLPGGSG